MKMKTRVLMGMAMAAAVAVPNLSYGLTTSQTDSIPLAATNWNDVVSFNLFDAALGTLNSVTVILSGHVEGEAKYESLDAQPAAITLDLAARVEVTKPDATSLGVVIPTAQVMENATADDGTLDFAGTSGSTFPGLTGDDSDSNVLSTNLADFIGIGQIGLPVIATGMSSGSGAGNLITQFATDASAEIELVYDFTPVVQPPPPAGGVPEPMTASLAVLGLTALASKTLRRRRV